MNVTASVQVGLRLTASHVMNVTASVQVGLRLTASHVMNVTASVQVGLRLTASHVMNVTASVQVGLRLTASHVMNVTATCTGRSHSLTASHPSVAPTLMDSPSLSISSHSCRVSITRGTQSM